MSRKHFKKTAKPQAAPTAQLDAQISDIAASTKSTFEKNWKWMVGLILVALSVVAAYQAVTISAENREASFIDRFDAIKATTADLVKAGDEHAVPDLGAIQTLVDDSRGAGAELSILKRSAQLLIARLDSIDGELLRSTYDPPAASSASTSSTLSLTGSLLGEGSADSASAVDVASLKEKRGQLTGCLESLLKKGRERFPNHPDMQHWAESIEGRLRGAADQTWLPAKRRYTLQPPPRGGSASPENAENTGHPTKSHHEGGGAGSEADAEPAKEPAKEPVEPNAETSTQG